MRVRLPDEMAEAIGQKKKPRFEALRKRAFQVSYGLMFLFAWNSCAKVNQISINQQPALIQLNDGTSIRAKLGSSLDREPIVIDRFVRRMLPLGMNWSKTLPNGDEDKGVMVGTNRVPTPLWSMSFLMEPNLRAGWLEFMAENLESSKVFRGEDERILMIREVSDPRQLEKGLWSVDVVADWYLFTPSNREGAGIKFNKRLTLKAVPPQLSPLQDKASPLEQALYGLQSSGLQITEIQEIPNG